MKGFPLHNCATPSLMCLSTACLIVGVCGTDCAGSYVPAGFVALVVASSALLALSAIFDLALAQPQSRCVIEFCVLCILALSIP